MAERDLYKEALADANKLKEAALKNGMRVLAEGFKDSLKETIEAELNEEASEDEEETMDEALDFEEEEDTMAEMAGDEDFDMDDDTDLDLDSDSDFDDEDSLEESAGFDEADLQEAIRQVLDEVDHGSLGEMEEIDPDTHDTGLMDQDSKESGWEEKQVPAKKDWTVKEAAYKKKISKLALENAKLKKGFATLKETYREVEVFNRKLFCLNKLLENKVVRDNAKLKESIVKQIDKARSSKEVERIYESLEMAVGLLSEGYASKKGKKASTLSEALGSHSRNERGVSDVRTNHLLSEDARWSPERMKLLSGITKAE